MVMDLEKNIWAKMSKYRKKYVMIILGQRDRWLNLDRKKSRSGAKGVNKTRLLELIGFAKSVGDLKNRKQHELYK
jgi:hypothetical protein